MTDERFDSFLRGLQRAEQFRNNQKRAKMIQGKNWKVFQGSNLDVLPTLEDNSIDAIVTDPPYELGFMGKKWDSSGIAYNVELWRECLRVLKPGGHLLSFGGSRTWHRIAVAIEDAGFEVRDSIAWMYGSGFPKSLDISKAIDKAAGAEREVIGTKIASPKGISGAESRTDSAAGAYGGESKEIDITAPATPEAQQWQGWGTALKPAFEPIIVARKPLIGTVAENVLTYGTGGLNIDGSRVGNEKLGGGTMPDLRDVGRMSKEATGIDKLSFGQNPRPATRLEQPEYTGRWPANVILDPYTAELLDEQSGFSKSVPFQGDGKKHLSRSMSGGAKAFSGSTHNDSGGASRFFYVAKASKRDRNEGLEGLPNTYWELPGHQGNKAEDGISNKGGSGTVAGYSKNFHPTVKPTTLMEYLIKLVTPHGGVVLDPFTGSGSTGKAAILQGFDFIGIELTEEYLPIIEARLKWAEAKVAEEEAKKDEALF